MGEEEEERWKEGGGERERERSKRQKKKTSGLFYEYLKTIRESERVEKLGNEIYQKNGEGEGGEGGKDGQSQPDKSS